MEFGIRLLLLLVAGILFLIGIFSSTLHQLDLISAGLLLVALAMIVEGTPLSKMRWNTDSMGGRRPPREPRQ